jgi:hypothetical protein
MSSEAPTTAVGTTVLFENQRLRVWELLLAPGRPARRTRTGTTISSSTPSRRRSAPSTTASRSSSTSGRGSSRTGQSARTDSRRTRSPTSAAGRAATSSSSCSAPAPWVPWLLDLAMLVHLGGRERTQGEYQSLLARTGYTLDRVTTLPSGQSLLEARQIPT